MFVSLHSANNKTFVIQLRRATFSKRATSFQPVWWKVYLWIRMRGHYLYTTISEGYKGYNSPKIVILT